MAFAYSLPEGPARVLEGFVQEYQASHPYLEITSKNYPQPEELYRALQSENVPTLALVETSWLPSLTQKQKLLMTVETWMPHESFLFNWSVKCNAYVPLWEASTVGSELMALPMFFTTRALILNPDVVAKSGMKVLPATWDQLVAAALKMADPKNSNRALALALNVNNSADGPARNLQVLNWQYGGEGLNAPSAASSDANGKALAILGKMQAALAPLDGSMAGAPVAMWVGDVSDYFALKALGLPVKTAALPGSTKQNRTTEMQAWSLCMFHTFPDNQLYKVQEMALFLVAFEQQLRWAEQTPYLAAHCKVFDNPFYRQERLADHNNLRIFLNAVSRARLVDTTTAGRDALKRVSKDLSAVLRGEKNLPDVLNPR